MGKDKKKEKGTNEKPGKKLKSKDYLKELAKLHVELVKLQEWVKAKGAQGLHRLRGARRCGEGRSDQGHHRASQPARVSRGGAARSDGA